MSEPIVYILNGDDDFAIAEFVDNLQADLGDATTAEMNTTQLDGRTTSLEQLVNAISAMPFLASRRLVLVTNPLALVKGRSDSARQKLLDLLIKVPNTTSLVLIESELLTNERDRRKGKTHWLEAWSKSAGEHVSLQMFSLPHGPEMAQWIISRAKAFDGQFTPAAATHLANQIGDDPRLADQEIQKLLAYANYTRPIEPDDVEYLTSSVKQGDVFAMVDAIGNRQGKQAQKMLHLLLAEQDPFSLFGMVIRQFRLLLLTREVIEKGGTEDDTTRELGIHPYVAKKVFVQAKMFTLPFLEAIYHRLLEMDEAIKTSQMEGTLALDILVAGLTR